MGLSSKQVINTDGLDWSRTLLQQSHDQSLLELHHRSKPPSTMRRQQHQNQQQSEPLKCPRCDSNNTKFCYYNNYNKSQPRHFCRACKRHWTKGGTLRNVPVGGGRKNKRPNKKSSSAAAVAAASAATASTAAASTAKSDAISTDSRLINSMFQPIRNKNISILPNNLALNIGDLHDEKSVSEILSQAVLIRPQSLNLIGTDNMENKSLINTNTSNTSASASTQSFFGNSSLQANFPPNQGLQCFQAFSSSTSSPFESSLSSISNSFQTSNVVCDYGEDQFKIMAEATVTSSCTVQPPWQVPSAAATAVSNGMDLPSYWNWEDIDTLVSADHINLPWDDSHDDLIKP